MEAIVFDGNSLSLKYEKSYKVPEIINDKEVIVKVAFSGVCGTDLHIVQGEFPAQKEPLILGHEFSGIIHKVGKNSLFKEGDRVVVDPNRPCNLCKPCRKGKYQYCKTDNKCNLGVFRNGGWAQYVAVPEDQVFLLPDHVTLEQGALCEPYSCVSHGFDRASPISVGDNVLIIGAGIIGNLWITTLHHQGHRNVTVVEVNKTRLDIVQKMDTGFKLMTPESFEKENKLFDVIIDCTGVGKVMELNFNKLDDGGKYVLFGCCPPTHRATINPFTVFDKELTLIGVKVNPFSFPTSLGWLSAMGERYLDYEKLGVKIYKLSEYENAIADLKQGLVSKAMFKIY